jgi:NADH dehydrogenase FAD-containing subunit
MYYTIAALRAVVDDEMARRVLVPLDNLLQRGKLVIGSVVDIRANEVILENGDAIAFDSLVIATGAASRFPVRALVWTNT